MKITVQLIDHNFHKKKRWLIISQIFTLDVKLLYRYQRNIWYSNSYPVNHVDNRYVVADDDDYYYDLLTSLYSHWGTFSSIRCLHYFVS